MTGGRSCCPAIAAEDFGLTDTRLPCPSLSLAKDWTCRYYPTTGCSPLFNRTNDLLSRGQRLIRLSLRQVFTPLRRSLACFADRPVDKPALSKLAGCHPYCLPGIRAIALFFGRTDLACGRGSDPPLTRSDSVAFISAATSMGGIPVSIGSPDSLNPSLCVRLTTVTDQR